MSADPRKDDLGLDNFELKLNFEMVHIVRESARFISALSNHVKIDQGAIQKTVALLTDEDLRKLSSPANYDAGCSQGTCTHARTHTHTHTHTYTHMHAHTHTNTHTYIHTHTHT